LWSGERQYFGFNPGLRLVRLALYSLSHTFALVILEVGSCFLPRFAWTNFRETWENFTL
jgi:hypothetical protein